MPCQDPLQRGPRAGAGARRGPQPDLEVRFAEPQPAVAPGQAVVCVDADRVLCGGWIR
ncbi:MAG: aminomethyltransferase beta-barrel domain-containing protein [Planctomycetota bacterium]